MVSDLDCVFFSVYICLFMQCYINHCTLQSIVEDRYG